MSALLSETWVTAMLRHVLLGVHCMCALGLAGLIVAYPKEMAAVAVVPLLLVGTILLGLTVRSRWVIVPRVVLIMLGAGLAVAMVIGNIAWSGKTVTLAVPSFFLFLAVEVVVILLAIAVFRRETAP